MSSNLKNEAVIALDGKTGSLENKVRQGLNNTRATALKKRIFNAIEPTA